MHVLQIVADSTEPLSIAQMTSASGYPRPTVHRIVAALVAERLLVEVAHTRTWALGLRLVQLASRSWSQSGLRKAAIDALRTLRDETGETIHLAVPSGHSMVYIDKLESPSAVQMASRIGTSVCLHSTAVGKAYMAALPQPECDSLLPELCYEHLTANTLTSVKALQAQLAIARRQGWTVDAEENEQGIFCFGCAILGPDGSPVGAISVSTLLFRQKADPQASYVEPLRRACAVIAQNLAQNPNLVHA